MVKRHEYVGVDFHDDAIVWKYFSLPDFISFLEQRKLYFTRADVLSDPNELPMTEADARAFFGWSMEEYTASFEQIKRKTYVNCWRLSDYESFGMWNAYADNAMGVAIKSTAGKLMSSCNNVMKKESDVDVTIGKVKYIDPQKEGAQPVDGRLNTMNIVFSKRIEYAGEQELRMTFESRLAEDDEALPIDVDVKELIDEIVVGSCAKERYVQLVSDIAERNGINVNVRKSIIK